MAFVVEQEKRSFPWMTVLIGVFVVAVVATAIYYFFFAESPLIETLSNKSYLEVSADELGNVKQEAGQETLVNHPNFKNLRQQASPLSTGSLGRVNPFQPF